MFPPQPQVEKLTRRFTPDPSVSEEFLPTESLTQIAEGGSSSAVQFGSLLWGQASSASRSMTERRPTTPSRAWHARLREASAVQKGKETWLIQSTRIHD